jgi:hypothetical protein
MLNRIALLLVVVSIVIAAPGSACADDDWELEGPIVLVCAFYSGFSLLLTGYNTSRMNADDPSRLGGAGGVVLGSFTVLAGAASVVFDHPATRISGIACMAVGGYTVYYSVKSLRAVQRKYIEAEEQGLVFEPIMIDDGTGKLGPGIQVSWTF